MFDSSQINQRGSLGICICQEIWINSPLSVCGVMGKKICKIIWFMSFQNKHAVCFAQYIQSICNHNLCNYTKWHVCMFFSPHIRFSDAPQSLLGNICYLHYYIIFFILFWAICETQWNPRCKTLKVEHISLLFDYKKVRSNAQPL